MLAVHGKENGQPNGNLTGCDGDSEDGVDPTGRVTVVNRRCSELHVGGVEHQFNAHQDDDGVLSGERPGQTDDEQQSGQA